MNQDLKITALEALKTMPGVNRTDVANILESVQQCYVEATGNASLEEQLKC